MIPSALPKILLASKSPRRQQLVFQLGLPFEVVDVSVEEKLDTPVPARDVAQTLAILKADGYGTELHAGEILLTADTVVVLDGKVLGKPRSRTEAFGMLSALSGKRHEVYTGVCLKDKDRKISFSECTSVFFRELSEDAINHYLDNYNYQDKAGAYGIQDWIGLWAVERLEGCYYNVMGLPVARICKELEKISM